MRSVLWTGFSAAVAATAFASYQVGWKDCAKFGEQKNLQEKYGQLEERLLKRIDDVDQRMERRLDVLEIHNSLEKESLETRKELKIGLSQIAAEIKRSMEKLEKVPKTKEESSFLERIKNEITGFEWLRGKQLENT